MDCPLPSAARRCTVRVDGGHRAEPTHQPAVRSSVAGRPGGARDADFSGRAVGRNFSR